MKKTIKIIFALLLLCVVSLCFCACRQPDGQPSAKSVTLIIVGKEEQTLAVYERELELNFVSDLFAALVKEQGSSFAYTSTTSAFGQFVNDITISIHPETYQKSGFSPTPLKMSFALSITPSTTSNTGIIMWKPKSMTTKNSTPRRWA